MTISPVCARQAERFFTLMQGMEPSARQAFLRIYHLAPHGKHDEGTAHKGDHVRLAMMEALLHPGIAYWVRMNLSLRVARKLAQTTGRHEKAEQLHHLLEAFHVAADAFALDLPLSEALVRRSQNAGQAKPLPVHSIFEVQDSEVQGVSAEEVDLIQTFKRRIIPGLVRSIRRDRHRIA